MPAKLSATVSSLDSSDSSRSDRSPAKCNSLPQITREARRYAVRELARRAGVSRTFFDSWTIETKIDKTTISFGPATSGKIHFVHGLSDSHEAAAKRTPVASAGWTHPRHDVQTPVDLILPFCESERDAREPLYQSSGSQSLTCRLDVLRSLLFTLSRVEETISGAVDEHERFPASASLAVPYNFMERPILDEYGLAFQQALLSICPGWRPQPSTFRVNLTHDIDDIGIPFEFRTALGHALRRHRPAAMVRHLVSPYSSVEPIELQQVRRLAEISSARGLRSAFFWKGSGRTPNDSGYDPAQPKVHRVIEFLRERGFELGVHPGYYTFRDRANLASEAAYLRQILDVNSPGGRQHYLRWCPETWLDWEACGLAYDSSLGFADRFGFRAGTAFPYRPWSFEQNRELKLIEVPLILMDCTPVKYMRLPFSEGLQRIATLIATVKQCGGVLTLLWHNTPLLDREYDGWYEAILDLLAGTQCFDLPSSPAELW